MGIFSKILDVVDDLRWSAICNQLDRNDAQGATMGGVRRFMRVSESVDIEAALRQEYMQNKISTDSVNEVRTMIENGHGNIEPSYREIFMKMLTDVAKANQDILNAKDYLTKSGYNQEEADIYDKCIISLLADPKVIEICNVDSAETTVTLMPEEPSVSFDPSAAEAAMNAAAQTAAAQTAANKARKNKSIQQQMAATAPA